MFGRRAKPALKESVVYPRAALRPQGLGSMGVVAAAKEHDEQAGGHRAEGERLQMAETLGQHGGGRLRASDGEKRPTHCGDQRLACGRGKVERPDRLRLPLVRPEGGAKGPGADPDADHEEVDRGAEPQGADGWAGVDEGTPPELEGGEDDEEGAASPRLGEMRRGGDGVDSAGHDRERGEVEEGVDIWALLRARA